MVHYRGPHVPQQRHSKGEWQTRDTSFPDLNRNSCPGQVSEIMKVFDLNGKNWLQGNSWVLSRVLEYWGLVRHLLRIEKQLTECYRLHLTRSSQAMSNSKAVL